MWKNQATLTLSIKTFPTFFFSQSLLFAAYKYRRTGEGTLRPLLEVVETKVLEVEAPKHLMEEG
jgi:hypothetical protein